MNDFSFTKVFCEVFSGLLVIFFAMPWFESGIVSILEFYKSQFSAITGKNLLTAIFFAYLIGLVIDAVGLSADDSLFKKMFKKNKPTEIERKNFFKCASEHLFAYRDKQWAYYSLYRNTCLIVAVGTIAMFFRVWNICSPSELAWLVAAFLILEVILLQSMRTLAILYNEITKSQL